MGLFTKLKRALLGKEETKAKAACAPQPVMGVDSLPPFRLATADVMRYDPQVRIGLGARNGLLMAGEIEVQGDTPEVMRWVTAQWNRIWSIAAHHFLRTKHYGFLPFEVSYREAEEGEFAGLIEVDGICDRSPHGTRLLVKGETIVGYVERDHTGNERRVMSPKGLVCTFEAACGQPYGCSLLARAYPAWHEKWAEGGAKRTIRLRMIKDAYLGDILWYPADRQVQLADGREVSWQEIAQQVVDSRQTGSAMTLPLLRDPAGHKLVDYTPPQGVGGATQIFQWKKDLDLEIWKALEVPPEIIQASTTGSGFSGRWIPFVVALSAVHLELAEIVRCVDRDILRPVAQLNFGKRPRYEIRARSLVEVYRKKFGQKIARAERGVGVDERG